MKHPWYRYAILALFLVGFCCWGCDEEEDGVAHADSPLVDVPHIAGDYTFVDDGCDEDSDILGESLHVLQDGSLITVSSGAVPPFEGEFVDDSTYVVKGEIDGETMRCVGKVAGDIVSGDKITHECKQRVKEGGTKYCLVTVQKD